METNYICTDLDIESQNDLSVLIEDLGEDVMVQFNGISKGMRHASFSLSYSHYSGPDESICAYCNLIENLSPEALNAWNECLSRVLDMGFNCGTQPNRYWVELRPSTIKRVAAIGASVAISIYPNRQEVAPQP